MEFFQSGWRPAAGWVCIVGLAYEFVLVPLVVFGIQLYTGLPLPVPPPTLNENLWELLAGLLGLAGWRSLDKRNGMVK